ncbi:hypothetical protein E2P81_ATG08769 [Venturia nashicola]|nr:hypothetical protein E2P81_ATG08769 [Venturia nashicola]
MKLLVGRLVMTQHAAFHSSGEVETGDLVETFKRDDFTTGRGSVLAGVKNGLSSHTGKERKLSRKLSTYGCDLRVQGEASLEEDDFHNGGWNYRRCGDADHGIGSKSMALAAESKVQAMIPNDSKVQAMIPKTDSIQLNGLTALPIEMRMDFVLGVVLRTALRRPGCPLESLKANSVPHSVSQLLLPSATRNTPRTPVSQLHLVHRCPPSPDPTPLPASQSTRRRAALDLVVGRKPSAVGSGGAQGQGQDGALRWLGTTVFIPPRPNHHPGLCEHMTVSFPDFRTWVPWARRSLVPQMAVGSWQLSVVSPQLAVVSCQPSVVSSQLSPSVGSCQFSALSSQSSVLSPQSSVLTTHPHPPPPTTLLITGSSVPFPPAVPLPRPIPPRLPAFVAKVSITQTPVCIQRYNSTLRPTLCRIALAVCCAPSHSSSCLSSHTFRQSLVVFVNQLHDPFQHKISSVLRFPCAFAFFPVGRCQVLTASTTTARPQGRGLRLPPASTLRNSAHT